MSEVIFHIPVIIKTDKKEYGIPLSFKFNCINLEISDKEEIEIIPSDNTREIKKNFFENLFDSVKGAILGYLNNLKENYGVNLKAKVQFEALNMSYGNEKLRIQIENTKPLELIPENCTWDSASFPFAIGILYSILGKEGEFFGSGKLSGQNVEGFDDETFKKKNLVYQKYYSILKYFFPDKYKNLKEAVNILEFKDLIEEKLGIKDIIKETREYSKKLPQLYDDDLEKVFYPLKLKEERDIERSIQEILTIKIEKEGKLTGEIDEYKIREIEKKEKEKIIKYEDLLKELLKSNKNFIIIGPAGSGKSTISKKITLDLIEKKYIPLIFELKLFSLNDGILLYNQKNLKEKYFGLKEEYLKKIKNKLVVLDGYDETSKDKFTKIFSYFKEYKCPIVITGRDYLAKELKNEVENSILYSIEPIEEKGEFLKKYEEEGKDFIKAIKRKPFALKFTQTAFYLLAIYDYYKNNKRIQENFDCFMEEFLNNILFRAQEGRGREISRNDFFNLIELYKEISFRTKFLKEGEEKLVFKDNFVFNLKKEMVFNFENNNIIFENVLIRQIDDNRFCFSHHLIQEYLGAKAISEKINNNLEEKFEKWGKEINLKEILIHSFFDKGFAQSSEVLPMAFALLSEEKQEEIYKEIKKIVPDASNIEIKTLMRSGFYNKNIKKEIKKELFEIGIKEIESFYSVLGYLSWFKERKENEEILSLLIKKLKGEDMFIHWASAEAIGKLGLTEDKEFNKKIINSLLEMLKDKNEWVRRDSAEAIGNLGLTEDKEFNKKVLNSLLEMLNDEDEYVRRASAEAIGKLNIFKDKNLRELFLEKIKDLDKEKLKEISLFFNHYIPKEFSKEKKYPYFFN